MATNDLEEGLKQLAGGRVADRFFVAVDLGGTNSRVAIALQIGTEVTPLREVIKFQASNAQDFLKGLHAMAGQISAVLGLNSSGGCVAAAGRILDGGRKVDVTNYEGGPEGRVITIEQLPRSLFPIEHSSFINDLESTCYGIYSLHVDGKLASFFQPLWGGNDITLGPQSYAVLAMGTGLGGALLIYSRSSRKHEVLPCEFGHTIGPLLGSAHPEAIKERRMVEFISKKLYNGAHGLEVEDICSGRGVGYTYEWLLSELSDPSAAPANISVGEIAAAAAQDQSSVAKEALLVHYRWLFRCAQNICIGNQTKGVFLAGDNQVNNEPFVKRNVAAFKEEFLNHPKSDWITDVPVYAQTVSFNINLLGAMYVAKTQ